MNRFACTTLVLIATTTPDSALLAASGRVPVPLIVDLSGDGVALTTAEEGVNFDLDADGVAERTSWTIRGSDDAFLAFDENQNGTIDSGQELIAGLTGPPHGFSLLSALDGFLSERDFQKGKNRMPDGRLDKNDVAFRRLILWQDLNHNGRSEEDELQSAEFAGITAIALAVIGVSESDAVGNVLEYRATAFKHGEKGLTVPRAVGAYRLR